LIGESVTPPVPGLSAKQLDKLLEDYRITGILGRGGMGVVYRATDPVEDRDVAIKVVTQMNDEIRERFRREVHVLRTLDHPGIVRIHDHGELPENLGLYFVMELIEGHTLAELIFEDRLSSERALKMVPLLCAALDHAHGQGIVHRDIKPANILIDSSDQVHIVDFGLARIFGNEHDALNLTTASERFGTAIYMAPEQRKATSESDHRADIYSLGVVIYEMLTGEAPLGKFVPLSQCAGTNRRLDKVVNRALSPDPATRYQRAGEVSSELAARSCAPMILIGGVVATALLLLWIFHKPPFPEIEIENDIAPLITTTRDGITVNMFPPSRALIPPVSQLDERAARVICLTGDDLIAGAAWGRTSSQKNAGSVYVMALDGSDGIEKIQHSKARPGDQFGAALHGGEDWFLVGAPGIGKALFYRKIDGAWMEEASFSAPRTHRKPGFGYILTGTRTRLFVSQKQYKDAPGAVHIFENHGQWEHRFIISPTLPTGSKSGGFGCGLALHQDLLFVSASSDSDGATHKQGAVYLFQNDKSGIWKQKQRILPPKAHRSQYFGDFIAFDGETLAVGALYDRSGGLKDLGAVYLYEEKNGRWQLTQALRPPLAGMDHFAIVLLANRKLFVGADLALLGSAGRGAVARYARNPQNGQWSPECVYLAEEGSSAAHFGFSLAAHGEIVALGGHHDSSGKTKGTGEVFLLSEKEIRE